MSNWGETTAEILVVDNEGNTIEELWSGTGNSQLLSYQFNLLKAMDYEAGIERNLVLLTGLGDYADSESL